MEDEMDKFFIGEDVPARLLPFGVGTYLFDPPCLSLSIVHWTFGRQGMTSSARSWSRRKVKRWVELSDCSGWYGPEDMQPCAVVYNLIVSSSIHVQKEVDSFQRKHHQAVVVDSPFECTLHCVRYGLILTYTYILKRQAACKTHAEVKNSTMFC